jgi:hypothetical protein
MIGCTELAMGQHIDAAVCKCKCMRTIAPCRDWSHGVCIVSASRIDIHVYTRIFASMCIHTALQRCDVLYTRAIHRDTFTYFLYEDT